MPLSPPFNPLNKLPLSNTHFSLSRFSMIILFIWRESYFYCQVQSKYSIFPPGQFYALYTLLEAANHEYTDHFYFSCKFKQHGVHYIELMHSHSLTTSKCKYTTFPVLNIISLIVILLTPFTKNFICTLFVF